MRIYLTEGFAGDPVRVTVNGTTVLDLPDARTNWSVGLAATASTEVEGPARVMVELPSRRMRAEHAMEAGAGRALVVRVGPEGIEFEEAAEPLRFA
jgi:hypothetical protein